MRLLLLCILVYTALAFTPKSGVKYAAVNDNGWKVVQASTGVATGVWRDTLNETGTYTESVADNSGWYRLDVWTNGGDADTTQAYAAGFLEGTYPCNNCLTFEGALTQKSMWENFQNFNNSMPVSSVPKVCTGWLVAKPLSKS
jgi:hypothetical protein